MTAPVMTMPKRVIQELTPTQQFSRAIERAMELWKAGHARVDANLVAHIEEARSRYLPGESIKEDQPVEQTSASA
jgi:hypothetical protein